MIHGAISRSMKTGNPQKEVLRLKRHLNARGINYLLNVGPDPMGRIPAPAQEILRRVGTLG